jgi:hypothetical protein
MAATFTYLVSYGVSRKILKMHNKLVNSVNEMIRREFELSATDDITLQVEDVDDFPGEWIDVAIEVDVVDLVYKLPDKGKLKVWKGKSMHINTLM